MPPEEEQKIDHWNERMEKTTTSSTSNELEKHLEEKGQTELLEKPATKRVRLLWAYEEHLKT